MIKKSKHIDTKSHQNTHKKDSRIRNDEYTKQPENNQQNGNSTSLPINNCLKYKLIKFSNPKTQNG